MLLSACESDLNSDCLQDGEALLCPSVAIGPANMAGQASQWVGALRNAGCDRSVSFQIQRESGVRFPADLTLDRDTTSEALKTVIDRDAILLEGCLWVDGSRPNIGSWIRLVDDLLEKGKKVGFIFHGSDVRNPNRHRDLHPRSIFRGFREERLLELSRRAEYTWEVAEYLNLPCFYTTPDLKKYAPPTATWLPLTIESTIIEEAEQLLVESRDSRDSDALRVFHSPSSREMKGTSNIVSAVESFARDNGGNGAIVFDCNSRPFEERSDYLSRLRSADLFVDQVGIGGLGLAALEALILGKAVVTDCGEDALKIYGGLASGIPLFDAAESIELALTRAIDWRRSFNPSDESEATRKWQDGMKMLRKIHDGSYSAAVICHELSALTPPESG